MTLIFRLIIRRDIWIFHSKVFSSGCFTNIISKQLKGKVCYGLICIKTNINDFENSGKLSFFSVILSKFKIKYDGLSSL